MLKAQEAPKPQQASSIAPKPAHNSNPIPTVSPNNRKPKNVSDFKNETETSSKPETQIFTHSFQKQSSQHNILTGAQSNTITNQENRMPTSMFPQENSEIVKPAFIPQSIASNAMNQDTRPPAPLIPKVNPEIVLSSFKPNSMIPKAPHITTLEELYYQNKYEIELHQKLIAQTETLEDLKAKLHSKVPHLQLLSQNPTPYLPPTAIPNPLYSINALTNDQPSLNQRRPEPATLSDTNFNRIPSSNSLPSLSKSSQNFKFAKNQVQFKKTWGTHSNVHENSGFREIQSSQENSEFRGQEINPLRHSYAFLPQHQHSAAKETLAPQRIPSFHFGSTPYGSQESQDVPEEDPNNLWLRNDESSGEDYPDLDKYGS
jgi:hypothetical protein